MTSEGNFVQSATNGNFVQPAIPRFNGHYDHWSMLMENFLRSKEYWSLVETGYVEPEDGASLTDAQQKKLEEEKLKDLKTEQKAEVVAVDSFEEEGEAEDVNPSIKLLWSATSVINLDTSSMNVRVGTKRQIMPSLEKKKRCC
ncbi:hypothetical protein LWI29_013062 [Acer saccharum]|uniref:Retrovirus-related Pol polyprotein from transposon TNT 1-94 n=1 Tax=Acer saccharum TaxID=4024 RepID=A0AA39RWC8_ACESA|nr:hypothetical protein LWI29_013062 [Acer saccharum]